MRKPRPLPPWMHRPHAVFTDQRGSSQGNESEHHKKYNNQAWVKYRARALAMPENIHCACGCGKLSTTMDHIIPHNRGGSFWDTRNHQGLATKCHNRKSGRERHGKIEEFVETKYGRIPTRRAHLRPHLGNQSGMAQ